MIHKNRERDIVAALRHSIAGQRIHTSKLPRFGFQVISGDCSLEARRKRSIFGRDWKRVAELRSPGLSIRVLQELGECMRRCQIGTRESRAIVERELCRIDLYLLGQKLLFHFESARERSGHAFQLSQQAKHHLYMKILAYFVDYNQIVEQRIRLMLRQNDSRRRCTLWNDKRLVRQWRRILPGLRVHCTHFSTHNDAALLE